MNLFEEAVIYSTVMHSGAVRKNSKIPYIMHPLEVAQILSTMTDDFEIITAGVLHDVIEDTDGTAAEIRARFGDRVAALVLAESEDKYEEMSRKDSWRRRKEESITKLKNSTDIGVEMVFLADKLSNLRSLSRNFDEMGDTVWNIFHQTDPEQHRWYYTSIAECLEMDLNRTGVFKEMVQLINHIWPGSFETEKGHYKKYREISIEGCEQIGKGAKGDIYRLDDELIVKVYNRNNTYRDIERETYLAKKAFLAGIPTAISFGIVKVGERYGSVFELLNSDCISKLIAEDPENVDKYAQFMADLALTIHHTPADNIDLPDYKEEVYQWIDGGIGRVSRSMAQKVTKLVDDIPQVNTMIHGDFHTGNVMKQGDDYLLIDMDRLSVCHPIIELSGIYMFYIGFGEMNRSFLESFMGFSCETAAEFYRCFMKRYLGTEDEAKLQKVIDQAALLCYVRLVRRCYKKGSNLSEESIRARDYYLDKIEELLTRVDSLGK